MRGMRIGVNGVVVPVSQAYATLMTRQPERHSANRPDAVRAWARSFRWRRDRTSDEFFLTFDQLSAASPGSRTRTVDRHPPPADGEPRPDIGANTFDEINATMATVTGVRRTSRQ